jgi:ketosteroid isomerase-like protein
VKILARSLRRLLCAVLLAGAPLLSLSQPYLSGPDAAAVREVIEAQLDAFRRDDAQRAFSFAAPNIRSQFGTAENFMEMVRTSYAAVYRPHSVKFETFQIIDEQVVQPVRLADAEGQQWVAFYVMQRQPDGGWRIAGCQLARLTEKGA